MTTTDITGIDRFEVTGPLPEGRTALEASAPPAAKVEAVSSAEPAVAANLQPGPAKKVIVMSCPELGTRSPHGEGPYTEKVMDKVQELQKLGRVFFGFDRANTTTAHAEDQALDWKNPEHIRKSKWMYGYKTAAKRTIQFACQGFDGTLVISERWRSVAAEA